MPQEKKADRSAWWLAAVGAVGVVGGAAISSTFNYFEHKSDIDAKMIELSVGILRAEPTPETAPLREWAITVIGERAAFNFNEAQRAALLNKALPFKSNAALAVEIGQAVSNSIRSQQQP